MREHGELFRDQYESRFVCSIIGGAPGGMGGPGKGNPNSQGGSGGTGQGGRGRPRGPGASIAASTNPGGITGNPNASQSGRGGQSFGNSTTADYDMAKQYGVTPDAYGQEAADMRDRLSDAYGTDDSLADQFGNFFAGMAGFNEEDPDEIDFNPQNPVGPRASWGWDPAGAIGGALGTAFGVPFVGGFLADQISAQFGRPLSVSLGPDVFGSDPDPVTGQPTTQTHTGGSMTVRDDNDPHTFLGTSPMLAGVGQGVANVAPSSTTFTGVDPAEPAPAPAPQAPSEELPQGLSPTDLPSGVVVDAGNTQLPASDLAALFSSYGTRNYRGKNRTPASALV